MARAARTLSAVVVVLGALAFVPASAFATFGGSTTVDVAPSVTVGQTGVVATITITNENAGVDSATPNTVCSSDAGFPCTGMEAITLLAGCGGLSGSDCFPGLEDPGVFAPPATATGAEGSACADVVFTVSVPDMSTGRLRLTPATTVVLPTGGSSCVIPVVLSVVGMPADDASEADGVQTDVITSSEQAVGSGTLGPKYGVDEVTVDKASPTIQTAASPGITLGGAVTDTATVSGLVNPVAGGTVTFTLFGPDEPPCQPPEAFTSTVPVGSGGTATSAPFTPTRTGTYRWAASYSGDANNNQASGGCGDAGETVVVSAPVAPPPPPPPPATKPAISVTASPGTVLGGQVSATAAVTGRTNPAPGSPVVFRLYSPDDPSCVGTPVFTTSAALSAAGAAISAPFTPPAPATGIYRWIATYPGDASNLSVATVCNAPGSTVTVTPRPSEVLSAGFTSTPRVGEPALLEVAGADPLRPISGLQVQFGEPRGLSGISACRIPDFGIALSPVRLELPYTFSRPGRHKITIIILSGSCSGELTVTEITIVINVASGQSTRNAYAAAKTGGGAGAEPSARAAKASTCKNTFLRPSASAVSRLKVATAILCLVNIERAKQGLKKLKRSSILAKAAGGHSNDMLKRRFFEHAGPGGPSFQKRLLRIRYHGRTAAENIGYGSNFNAKLMVQAWMNSPPHKANILAPGSKFAGIGIAAGLPVTPLHPGSTYTMDFGSALK